MKKISETLLRIKVLGFSQTKIAFQHMQFNVRAEKYSSWFIG